LCTLSLYSLGSINQLINQSINHQSINHHLKLVLLISSVSNHESKEIKSKNKAHGEQDHEVLSLSKFGELYEYFVKIDWVWRHEDVSTEC